MEVQDLVVVLKDTKALCVTGHFVLSSVSLSLSVLPCLAGFLLVAVISFVVFYSLYTKHRTCEFNCN